MIDTKQVRQSLMQDRAVMDAIRRRAHQISLERGYSTPQHMADDWFRAENEVLEKLIQEEIKRRQKMNAAISESAMAEEAIPAVTLPAVAEQPAAGAAKSSSKKSATRRKKSEAKLDTNVLVAEDSAPEPVTAVAPLPEAATTGAPIQPKQPRKKSVTAKPAAETVPPRAASSVAVTKPKPTKSTKKKSS
ncbi:MAG: hypothetical protein SNJ67_00515 [Chloracidobacterium sp.]|uniref:Uncharacterized protein n=1 Tax=Chloracidobacterium validum TaxID=2821543 RepID=A0ABX8B7I0_9BACT|nr:hypothetical protein [Chloracidobacterium validum]QUW02906.1 hypothetical protein J8C06_00180 [Chloracidobacterium validum]